MNIPFNKPYLSGKETEYIKQAVGSGKISGDGIFTNKCQKYFEKQYGFGKTFLTTSCTDALEMAAILSNIESGDEIIAPSFTFVSTVNAFVLRGAKIVFADVRPDVPNINENEIESLITPKTKAIVPVHYAGISCDMDRIKNLADKYNLLIVEDAAQAIDSYYKNRPLGSIGDFAAFSFHETKNISSGEGGMLSINNQDFIKRAEIVREKGTNRSSFFRGEINKYEWVDVGSSFLPSDIIAAFLYAQLENLSEIQLKRKFIWYRYYEALKSLEKEGFLKLPYIPEYATNNYHMFYLVLNNPDDRNTMIEYLRQNNIHAVFHYQSLHKSQFYLRSNPQIVLPNTENYSDCLLRLPFFYDLTEEQIDYILEKIHSYFIKN
jgi:dTDP-4-amino-4,6-dideoxygalactose transaminase